MDVPLNNMKNCKKVLPMQKNIIFLENEWNLYLLPTSLFLLPIGILLESQKKLHIDLFIRKGFFQSKQS